MRTRLFPLLVFFLLSFAAAESRAGESTNPPAAAGNRKFTYVLVHGAWAGGWAYKQVDDLLTADGHKVYRPTLTGQGERVHLADTNLLGANIGLSVHIQDIVNVIVWEDLHDVVLVGHSYGGMVITGVADRVPERLKHVIYIDAFLPDDGEALDTIGGRTNRQRRVVNGFLPISPAVASRPLPHEVPHPANTVNEPISLKNQDVARKIPTTFILTVEKDAEPPQDMFFRFSERAKARGWTVLTMEGDHNVPVTHPKALAELLEKAPR